MNRPSHKAQTLAHQTEAFAELDVLAGAIRDAVTRLVEAHAAATRAQRELVAANTLVSGPQFVHGSCPDCYGSGVIDGELCPGCKGRVQVAS